MPETFDRPAPVDAREDGLRRWDFGPVPPLDHPRHPTSDWHLYDCPEPGPWGSYLDTEPLPLPPGGGGPIAYAMDLVARGVVR